MQKEEFFKLLEKYELEESSLEERQIVDNFLESFQREKDNWQEWELSEKESIKLDIYANMRQNISRLEPAKKNDRFLFFKIAASVLLLITTGILGYYVLSQPDVQLITKNTARGQKSTITLSDGSVVRLNSGSSIMYPQTFVSDNRSVKLIGEAFFEVIKNPPMPFIVQSEGITTTVLGTSFNVRAFPEERNIEVTVATGKVNVVHPENKLSQLLIPSQQAVYNKSQDRFEMREISLDKYLAWKKGIIFLDKLPMHEAAVIFERWFDVSIEFENESVRHCVINGEFREDNIENILENVKFLTGIDYRFKNENTIVINGTGCN